MEQVLCCIACVGFPVTYRAKANNYGKTPSLVVSQATIFQEKYLYKYVENGA